MKLSEIYSNGLKISFEVFPPKEDEKIQSLFNELEELKVFNPAFVSLTWGAGGNNNTSTDLIQKIKLSGLDVLPHFTCMYNTKKFVLSHIKKLNELNIDKILALRGDKSEDSELISTDFRYANELVEFLKFNSEFSIGVAGYPEKHIEAENIDIDIYNLKRKVDAGADAIFTQLFFDNDKFYKYCELLAKQDINIPVIPGIMPIISKKQVEKMTKMANIIIPKSLLNKIEKYQDSSTDMVKMGIDYCTEQCEALVKFGVLGLHFFTLNKSLSTKTVLNNIL